MAYILFAKVELDGKVLPLGLVDRRRPDLLVLAVQHLEVVLGQALLAQDGAGFEIELVCRVVRGFVPHGLRDGVSPTPEACSARRSRERYRERDRILSFLRRERGKTYQVLVAEIQRPRGILLDAEMKRLDPRGRGAAVVAVALELQAGAAEPALGLEDAAVAQRHLEGLVAVAVEPRAAGVARELEDLAPLEALALDVVGAERRAAARVEVGGRQGRLDAPVEDDGALDRGVGGLREGRGQGHGAEERRGEGGLEHHDDLLRVSCEAPQVAHPAGRQARFLERRAMEERNARRSLRSETAQPFFSYSASLGHDDTRHLLLSI